MSSQPYIVEMAVLLLFAFVLGGLAGFWARRWLKPHSMAGSSEESAQQAQSPESSDEMVSATEEPVPSAIDRIPKPVAAKTEPVATADAPSATPAAAKPAKATRSPRKAAEPKAAKPVASAGDDKGKPVLLATARAAGPDDLKKIKGIGPRIEKLLHGLGIYHYDQIAAWGPEEISWVDNKLSFRGRIDREGWVSQARALVRSGG